MRIAILADIHGNAEALAQTLSEAQREGVEKLMLLGDFVGYYHQPARVMELLSAWPTEAIRGNHDRILIQALETPEILDEYRRSYGSALDVALGELPAPAIQWLRSLPEVRQVSVGRQNLFLCHGSPQDPDAYVYWNSDPQLLEKCRVQGVHGVLMGHTHHPFVLPGNPWLANPGSVGQARDVGGLASWILMEADTGTLSFRRTPYDVEPVLRAYREHEIDLRQRDKILYRANPALASFLESRGSS